MKKIEFGGWIMSGNPQIAEIMSNSNIFDFLVIDMQHGTITSLEMENILSRISCTKYVRLRKKDDSLITQALDAGANHIIIPNVMKLEDIIYDRSYGLYRSRGYGFKEKEGKHDIIAQIEYPLSKEYINDIFNHINGYMIGPYDLKRCGGTEEHEKMFLEISKQKNIKRGYHIVFPTKEKILEKIKMGYNFLALGTDLISVGEWCRQWDLSEYESFSY